MKFSLLHIGSTVLHAPKNIWSWTMRHKIWSAILIVALLASGRYVYAQQNKQPEYTTMRAEYRDLVKTLDISGIVDAKEKARLRFIAGGKVVYVGAQEGSWVKKNQTIATIDQASLQKSLEKTLNLYSKERLDWEDTRDDIKDDALNTTQLRAVDRNQLDLNNTVLDVEIQSIAIQNTRLGAPFAGILTAAPTLSAGVQLLSTDYFEVVNPETLIFRAEVDEADIGSVGLDQLAKISLDSYPDLSIESNVRFISYTSSQTSSGTVFLIELPITGMYLGETGLAQSLTSIDNEVAGDTELASASAAAATKLRLGMNGEATITLDTKNHALSIPIDTIRERDDKKFVDIKTGPQTIEEREITTGMETDEYIEVLSGLSESDEVVVP